MTDDLGWLGVTSPPRILAPIHATVDLERTLADAGWDVARAGTAREDVLLGARIVLVDEGEATIAVAEPSTEGRLAATLARSGEGIVGRYVAAPAELDEVRRLAAAAGVALSRPEAGPYGSEILVLTASPAGPHVLLVDPRAVPSPG